MTILEVIERGTEFLARKDVDSPRLQTELLVAYVLKLRRMQLYLNFERILSDTDRDAVRVLLKRRSQREPLQHIVGSTSFCGLDITVNPDVLVPRPETEILAEAGWEFLNSLSYRDAEVADAQKPDKNQTIVPSMATALDFGTGSGCIAIALAIKCPTARLVALDASAQALGVAKQNAELNGVSERIEFFHGNGFAALTRAESSNCGEPFSQTKANLPNSLAGGPSHLTDTKFDLIVSNPPYIPTAEIATLQTEVRDFDPGLALDGGADGLVFYRLFAAQAAEWLRPGGKFMLEFGDGQAADIQRIFVAAGWVVESVRKDYTQRERFLIARRA